jgi:hypothetical protein
MQLDPNLVVRAIGEKGYITMEEPACGAGSLLIAAIEHMEEMGFDPKKHLFFIARDVSRLCFNMCYMQMACLGASGVVEHGNTISLKIYESRPTPSLIFDVKRQSGLLSPEYIEYMKGKMLWSKMDELIKDSMHEPRKIPNPKIEEREKTGGRGFGKESEVAQEKSKKKKNKKEPSPDTTQLNFFDITLDNNTMPIP